MFMRTVSNILLELRICEVVVYIKVIPESSVVDGKDLLVGLSVADVSTVVVASNVLVSSPTVLVTTSVEVID